MAVCSPRCCCCSLGMGLAVLLVSCPCPACILPMSCLLPGWGQALYVPCDRKSLATSAMAPSDICTGAASKEGVQKALYLELYHHVQENDFRNNPSDECWAEGQ